MTDSSHAILDEIIENIMKYNSYEVPFDVLSTVFKPTDVPYRTTKERILLWAIERQLMYEYSNETNPETVRFFRK